MTTAHEGSSPEGRLVSIKPCPAGLQHGRGSILELLEELAVHDMKLGHVAVVTGANKGIGFAIVRGLALRHAETHKLAVFRHEHFDGPRPSSSINRIYLTARSPTLGKAAVAHLKASDEQLLASRRALTEHGGLTDVTYAPLDVTSVSSITKLATFLKRAHPSGIDLLVNNAGIAGAPASPSPDAADVRKVLDTNYYGVLRMCEHFMPLMKPGGVVVNVASVLGKLGRYSEGLAERFRRTRRGDGPVGNITTLMEEFVSAVERGDAEAEGWGARPSAYAVSKAGVIGATTIIAHELSEATMAATEGAIPVGVEAVCPGFTATELTGGRGSTDLDKAAGLVVSLGMTGVPGMSGEFWSKGKVVEEC